MSKSIQNIRKLADHYSKKASHLGFPARSVFKLQEIDEKYKIIKSNSKIIDLGCNPGSWSQYVHTKLITGHLIGLDITPFGFASNINNSDVLLKSDKFKFYQIDVNKWIPSEDWIEKTDVVLSDMMSNTTGDKDLDCHSSCSLAMTALELAGKMLPQNKGVFVVKVFNGKYFPIFDKIIRQGFNKTEIFKPKSSRSESREVFYVCSGKKSKINRKLWDDTLDE